MVFLTLDAKTNGQTFFFKEQIPNPRLIKLASCSLYNSWHTLKQRGGLFYKVENTTNKEFIRPGHHNEDGIVNMLQNAFTNHSLLISTHTPTHILIIGKNTNTAGFWFDEDLAKILDISPKVMASNGILFQGSTYQTAITSIVTLSTKILTCITANRVIFWLASQSLGTRKKESLILRIFKITRATQSLFDLQTALP